MNPHCGAAAAPKREGGNGEDESAFSERRLALRTHFRAMQRAILVVFTERAANAGDALN
jgi:hypothetical protein